MENASVIIDFDHLEKQTMGDKELAREVMQIFIDQMQLQMDQLSAGSPDLKEKAHSIKGSARGIGAWGLAECAESVELADGRQAQELDALLTVMKVTCEEARRFIVGA